MAAAGGGEMLHDQLPMAATAAELPPSFLELGAAPPPAAALPALRDWRGQIRLFRSRLVISEVSGALGDLGTFIPIVVALSIQYPLSFPVDSRAPPPPSAHNHPLVARLVGAGRGCADRGALLCRQATLVLAGLANILTGFLFGSASTLSWHTLRTLSSQPHTHTHTTHSTATAEKEEKETRQQLLN